jgi:hypothetical protein
VNINARFPLKTTLPLPASTASTASTVASTSSSATTSTAAPQQVSPTTVSARDGVDAPTSTTGARQAMASVSGQRLAGTASANLGAALLDSEREKTPLSTTVRNVLLGAALLAAPLLAFADTVFLDHNNAPKEIAVAQQLARSKGEPFVLVRPDQASLEQLFAKAERGEANIRHLILSGHSSGLQVWGESSDGTHRETSIDDMKALKDKFPKAFAQVQHVTFMSCYSGSAGNSAQWNAVFDKARAITGFYGSAPSKDQPAAHKMLKSTELAVRALPAGKLSPQQAMIAAKAMGNAPGANVTVFAARIDGVHHARGQAVTPLAQAEDRANMLRLQAFEPYLEARAGFEQTPTNHARSPLRDYYNALQSYSNALPADAMERSDVNAAINTTIRLIYADVIVGKFVETHAQTINNARAELSGLGVVVPADVKSLTRAGWMQLGAKIDAVDIDSTKPAAQELRRLVRDGLRDLSPDVIPSTWIG